MALQNCESQQVVAENFPDFSFEYCIYFLRIRCYLSDLTSHCCQPPVVFNTIINQSSCGFCVLASEASLGRDLGVMLRPVGKVQEAPTGDISYRAQHEPALKQGAYMTALSFAKMVIFISDSSSQNTFYWALRGRHGYAQPGQSTVSTSEPSLNPSFSAAYLFEHFDILR